MTENRGGNSFVKWSGFALIGALFLNVFMQVAPHEAISNLAQWIQAAGFNPPRWLQPKAIDIYGRPITLALTIIFGIWFLSPSLVNAYRWLTRRRPIDGVSTRPSHERQFVTATVDQLLARIEGMMPLDAQKIAAAFKGKWMKVSGPLESVGNTLNNQLLVRLIEPPAARLQMFFNSEWHDRLEVLMRGEHVTIMGKIAVLSEGLVWLEECELTS